MRESGQTGTLVYMYVQGGEGGMKCHKRSALVTELDGGTWGVEVRELR